MYHTEITDAFLLKHINKPEAIIEKFKDLQKQYKKLLYVDLAKQHQTQYLAQ
jgi:hypothetical protein